MRAYSEQVGALSLSRSLALSPMSIVLFSWYYFVGAGAALDHPGCLCNLAWYTLNGIEESADPAEAIRLFNRAG